MKNVHKLLSEVLWFEASLSVDIGLIQAEYVLCTGSDIVHVGLNLKPTNPRGSVAEGVTLIQRNLHTTSVLRRPFHPNCILYGVQLERFVGLTTGFQRKTRDSLVESFPVVP